MDSDPRLLWANWPRRRQLPAIRNMMGYLLVLAAGLFQGSFMLPMKFTRGWAWENTWLVFSATAYLVWPWFLAALTLPHLGTAIASTSGRSLTLVEAMARTGAILRANGSCSEDDVLNDRK